MLRQLVIVTIVWAPLPALASGLCVGFGPQTPRDISSAEGTNARIFTLAPPARQMNLCNLHFHAQAEHKGPGFSRPAGEGEHRGFACDEAAALPSPAPAASARDGNGCKGLAVGDTVEVHWVFTSCDTGPGEGLGACLTAACANPELRVESQVFLVVDDPSAIDFATLKEGGVVNGYHQPVGLPGGDPVVFAGSTTGPSFSESVCSPLQVTWSVRPTCLRVNIRSLDGWCADNPSREDYAHGVRPLVTAPELLAPIGR